MIWNKAIDRALVTLVCLWMSSGLLAGTSFFEGKDSIEVGVVDGPYVIYQPDGKVRVVSVDSDRSLRDTVYNVLPKDLELDVCCENGRYPFKVRLHACNRPAWKVRRPSEVFVMSDPHGRMDCVVSLLQGNGVIDQDLNWSYGKKALVIIGDVFDRGEDVTQIFWLLYKLEKEAEEAGGAVYFLLGNHEPMVLSGDMRYTKAKYKRLAERIGCEFPSMMGPETELGRWLSTRNAMMKSGDLLFVHGGLSEALYQKQMDIPTLNEEMSRGLFYSKQARKKDSTLAFLYGNDGPIWYRGMVINKEKYHPLSSDVLKKILKYYGGKRVIVGHTIFDDITSFYGRKVIAVNVDNPKNRKDGKGRAIVIRKKHIYVAGDGGLLHPLSTLSVTKK